MMHNDPGAVIKDPGGSPVLKGILRHLPHIRHDPEPVNAGEQTQKKNACRGHGKRFPEYRPDLFLIPLQTHPQVCLLH